MTRPTPGTRRTIARGQASELALRMLAIAALGGCLLSCKKAATPLEDSPSPDSQTLTLGAAVDVASEPYPRASWRLSDTPTSSMVVAASHIVVSFKNAKRGNAWSLFESRGSERSIEDATQIALGLARQLFDAPARFDELAKKWSDDSTTAQLGGRLGVFRGDQVPEEMLDALAVIPQTMIGERVLRTAFGFHILRRDALPAEGRVSLGRILLGFVGSPQSWELRRRSSRTLAEARELADVLSQQLADAPDKLDELAYEHSDGVEALRHGDMGELEEYSRIAYPVRRAVASELVRGSRPAVIQTELGMEIVVRASTGERKRYAASQILVGDLETPDSQLCRAAKRTRAEAGALATRVAGLIKGGHKYESVSKEFCDGCTCTGFEWTSGQADPRIESALANTRPGQVVGPVETPIGYVLLRRELPSAPDAHQPASPAESLHLGIPRPPITSVEHYVTLVEGEALAREARRTAQHMLAAMADQLAVKEREAIAKAYETLASAWEGPPGRSAKGRHAALKEWRRQIVASVGADKAQALMNRSSEWAMRSAGLRK
jgi:hypothetical protein